MALLSVHTISQTLPPRVTPPVSETAPFPRLQSASSRFPSWPDATLLLAHTLRFCPLAGLEPCEACYLFVATMAPVGVSIILPAVP